MEKKQQKSCHQFLIVDYVKQKGFCFTYLTHIENAGHLVLIQLSWVHLRLLLDVGEQKSDQQQHLILIIHFLHLW